MMVEVSRRRWLPASKTFAPAGGLLRLRQVFAVAPIVAIVLALGATAVLADGPEVDPAGTVLGAAEDLAGISIGGGQGFAVLDADGAFDAVATAKVFEDAKTKEPFAYNLAGYVNQNRLAINFMWVLISIAIVVTVAA